MLQRQKPGAWCCSVFANNRLIGTDLEAIISVISPHMSEHLQKMMDAMRSGQPKPDMTELKTNEIDAALARLPETPDENLRQHLASIATG